MQVTPRARRNSLTSQLGRLFAAVLFLLALSPSVSQADHREARTTRRAMKGTAGTAFNLTPAATFPWHHEVRGMVQLSNLGNCTVRFAVNIDAGSACKGGHLFCLSGTLTITTLAGDELQGDVVGWADASITSAGKSVRGSSISSRTMPKSVWWGAGG